MVYSHFVDSHLLVPWVPFIILYTFNHCYRSVIFFSASVNFMISTTSKKTWDTCSSLKLLRISSLDYQYLSVGRGIKSYSLKQLYQSLALRWPKQHLWRLHKDNNQLPMKATFTRRYEWMVNSLGGEGSICWWWKDYWLMHCWCCIKLI